MNNLIETFKTLVQIYSPSGGEEDMVKHMIKWIEKIGLKYKIDKIGNIYTTNGVKGKPILLCAHMDTVEPSKNIKPVIQNGVIKSSGNTILGADNKASIAAIMHAVEVLKKQDKLYDKPFEVVFSVQEETEGGIGELPGNWIKSKIGFVFDKADAIGKIVIASPYIINFYVQIKGKAAHASMPEKANNAFTASFDLLSKLKIGRIDKWTTVNIGKIQGGSGINTVPELIEFAGEVRSFDKQSFQKNLKQIEIQCHKIESTHKTKVTFATDGFLPGYKYKETDAVIQIAKNILEQAGEKPQLIKPSSVSDANVLNQKGIQVVNLSDGTIDPHTTKEKISIKSLVQLTEIANKLIINDLI